MSAEVASTGETATGPLDVVRLVGIGGIGHHGVLASERQDGQTFLADLTLSVDTRAAARGDDLTETVNYAELAANVVAVIEGEPVNLIETLATRVAEAALGFAPVREVTVTLHKPDAPVGVPFSDVQVEIHRRQGDDLTTISAAGDGVESIEPSDSALADDGAASVGGAMPPVVVPAAAAAPPVVTSSPAVAQEEAASGSGPDLRMRPDQPTAVIIAMGGNIGDVRSTLKAVVSDLNDIDGVTVVEVSPLARTAPVLAEGADPQPDFLNAVVQATTTLAPKELLDALHVIEDAYGRKRTIRWGERTLDLDIIVFGTLSSDDPELLLPHPRAKERAFVLVPWAHMDPDAVLPGLGGGPVADLAETAPDRTGVRWLALDWMNSAPVTGGQPAKPSSPPPAPAADQAQASEAVSAVDEVPSSQAEVAGEEEPATVVSPAQDQSAAEQGPGTDDESAAPEQSGSQDEPASDVGSAAALSTPEAAYGAANDEAPAGDSAVAEAQEQVSQAGESESTDGPAGAGQEQDSRASVSDLGGSFERGADTAEQESTQDEDLSDLELLAPAEGEGASKAAASREPSSPSEPSAASPQPAPSAPLAPSEPSAASPQPADVPWAETSSPQASSPIVPKWQPLRRNNP